MTTKHEAALTALDAAYERTQEVRRNRWAYTYAEEMLAEHWPTIRDALTAQGERAYEQGAQDVLYIRCMEHREVPQYNRREINGSECAACAVEEATNGPEHAVRCIGCGRTEDELHAPDCSHINGTAQQGERVAEGCDCSFGDTCSCAYDCRCRAEFKHLREEGGELINTGLRLVALADPAPSAPPEGVE